MDISLWNCGETCSKVRKTVSHRKCTEVRIFMKPGWLFLMLYRPLIGKYAHLCVKMPVFASIIIIHNWVIRVIKVLNESKQLRKKHMCNSIHWVRVSRSALGGTKEKRGVQTIVFNPRNTGKTHNRNTISKPYRGETHRQELKYTG